MNITWSKEASTTLPNGSFYSAFQSYSYLAKVDFDNHSVLVVLPPGAAARPVEEWEAEVIEAASQPTTESIIEL